MFYTVDKYADAKFATAYKALMRSIVNNLNTHLNHPSVTDKEIDQVFELEQELANVSILKPSEYQCLTFIKIILSMCSPRLRDVIKSTKM